LALLYKQLFLVCSNGGIPNLKLSTALMNVHQQGAVYHHAESSLSWAPSAGGELRKVAKHWRDIAMCEDKRVTCLSKAWGWQTQNRLGHFKRL
jgi:hypothetical protein